MTAKFCAVPYMLVTAASVLEPELIPAGAPSITKALLVAAITSVVLFIFSAIPTTLRILIRDKNYIFQNVNGYWTPNVPLLGSMMVAIYAILSASDAMMARAHIAPPLSVSIGQLLNISVLVPTPLFLWAWSYAFGAAFSFHTVAHETTPCARRMRLRPGVLNCFFIAVPILVVALNVIALPILTSKSTQAVSDKATAVVVAHGFTTDPQYWGPTLHQCHVGDGLYRTIWAIWSTVFLLALSIYVTYSRLLYEDLQNQLTFLDLEPMDPVTQDSPNAGTATPVETRKGSRATKRRTTKVTTLRVVRKNIHLGKFEMLAFSLYCSPWAVIGFYKALRGFDAFLKVPIWGTVLCLEFLLAFVCTTATLGVATWRSFNIYKAQRQGRRRLPRTGTGHSLQVIVQTDCQVDVETTDEENLYQAFARDVHGAYSTFPDIAQLASPTSPIRVSFPSTRSLIHQEEVIGEVGAWNAPAEWGGAPGGGGGGGRTSQDETRFPPTGRTVSGVTIKKKTFD